MATPPLGHLAMTMYKLARLRPKVRYYDVYVLRRLKALSYAHRSYLAGLIFG